MTEPTHTPGPWKYGQSKYDYDAAKKTFVELPLTHQASHFGDGASIFGADGTEIAGNDEYQVFNKPEDVALMLAAPDMYEALQCACDQYCIGYAGDRIVKCEDCIIRKALCKARGETE